MSERSAENDAPTGVREWYESGDGHGYAYQYIGPIHYLCECGDHFLNRERWLAHTRSIRAKQRVCAMSETHGADWSDTLPGEPPSCACGYNGTPEECAASRAGVLIRAMKRYVR